MIIRMHVYRARTQASLAILARTVDPHHRFWNEPRMCTECKASNHDMFIHIASQIGLVDTNHAGHA